MGVTVRLKLKGRGQPWWVFIAHQGKRRSIKVGDRDAAEALASKLREALKAGGLPVAPEEKILTFGTYAEKWLDGYGETSLKHSTWRGYQSILRLHLGGLRDRPLDRVSRPELKELIFDKVRAGLSSATVTRIKALVSVILAHALEDGLLPANPAAGLGRLIKGKDRKADVNPLTREEAQALLEAVEKHYPRYHPFFLCALRTGLRLGELLALEWGDVDFRGGFIDVRRAFVRGRLTTPKNHKSRRVDMSTQLAETFQNLLPDSRREAWTMGWGEVSGLVFPNEVGNHLDPGNLRRRVFWPALAKAGLRRVRIHDLRHTFASMLIQNGESLAYVRDQLGHSSIQVTVDVYGHLVPGANREAVDKLDDSRFTTYGPKTGCNLGAEPPQKV